MTHVDEGKRADEDEVATLGATGDDCILQQCNRGMKRLGLVGGPAVRKRGRQVRWSTEMHVHMYIHLRSVSAVPREHLVPDVPRSRTRVFVSTERRVTSRRRGY